MDIIQRPDIFKYANYRQYLNDYYAYKKVTDRSFTYAKFSKKAGIQSLNYFKLVKDDHRNLTPANVRKFASALELAQSESDYFEKLVHYCQSRTSEEKSYYFEKLKGDLAESGKNNINDLTEDLYDSFATFILRELVELADFKEDLNWIQRKLAFYLDKSEIRRILSTLEKNQLLIRDSQGRLQVKDDIVHYQREKTNHAVQSFHIKSLENSIDLIKKLPFEKRDMVSAAIAVSEKDFKNLMTDINRAMASLVSKYGVSHTANAVVQINTQILKVTQ